MQRKYGSGGFDRALIAVLGTIAIGSAVHADDYESAFLKLGTYPSGATHDWNPNNSEVQGVTHDASHWYFTATHFTLFEGITDTCMRRIPVAVPLDQDVRGHSGFAEVCATDVPVLDAAGYDHWGDVDHYEYGGVGYLFIPMTGSGKPAIGVFRASDLAFVNYSVLPGQDAGAGWCALDRQGDLFSSNNHPDSASDANALRRYRVDWDKLVLGVERDWLSWSRSYRLRDTTGSLVPLNNMQGGEFSDSGELLYISSGSGECLGGGNGVFESDGIHVFETDGWTRVRRSMNRFRSQDHVCSMDPSVGCPVSFRGYEECGRCSFSDTVCLPETSPQGCMCRADESLGTCTVGYFEYTFDNGCVACGLPPFGGFGSNTPEGLTYWDLDEVSAPDGRGGFLGGQLHVLVNHYNRFTLCDDELTFHHFGARIHVDPVLGSPAVWADPLPGTRGRPFQTLADALEWYPAWDGAEIVLEAGSYPETGRFTQRVRWLSGGGVVRIGR